MTTNQTSLTPQNNKPKFSVFMNQDQIKALVSQAVGKNAQRFTAGIISAVSNSPALQECTQRSILSGALLGEALGLSPSPQLGHYYLVPFKRRIRDEQEAGRLLAAGLAKRDEHGNVVEVNAQFILGAKGYKQLAMRSGQYLDIDVLEIKEGEYKGRDKKTGKQIFEFIEDDEQREELATVGYMAYFELLNGFRKVIYWTKSKMMKHASKYSQAFDATKYDDFINGRIPKNELWKYSSFWYQNFAEMAFKTLIRNLLSQWGILSIEMQEAIAQDEMVYDKEGVGSYVDYDAEADIPVHEGSATPVSDTTDIPVAAAGENFDFFSGAEGGAQ